MIYLTLFEITCIIVLITDISGIVDHLKQWISHWLTDGKYVTKDFTLTLIDCSFCQNWWICLFYIIFTGNFSITNMLFILLCSFVTPLIAGCLYLLRDLMTKLIEKLNPIK